MIEKKALAGTGCAKVGKDKVFTDREYLLAYSYDATGLEYLPDAVVFAESEEDVARVMAFCRGHGLPLIAARRRRGLYRRGAGRPRRRRAGVHAHEPHPAPGQGEPPGRGGAGGDHLRPAGGGREGRPFLSPRPGQPEDLDHRRQRRRERRRPALLQVRGDRQLCPGAGGVPDERRKGPPGLGNDQERGRLRPEIAADRLRGDAGRGDAGDPAPAAAAAAPPAFPRRLRLAGGGRPLRAAHHPEPCPALGARVHGPQLAAGRLRLPGAAARRPGAGRGAGRDRRQPGRGRRKGGAVREAGRRRRGRSTASGPKPSPSRRPSGRRGATSRRPSPS